VVGRERDERRDAGALDLVGHADDRRLDDRLVADQRDSTSIVPRRWPLTLITSSTRPMIQKYPSSSRRAPSPAK
jgi:hypothetical protein